VPWSGAPDCPVCHRTVSGAPGDFKLNFAPSGFSEVLRYNSPDCPMYHRTVSGAPRPSNSELASFGNPLRYNSPDMSGVHRTVRCNGGATTTSAQRSPTAALNACQRAQRSSARAGGTPDSLQGMSGAPQDSQAGPLVRAPTVEPNGRVTWLAHRTVSGGAPDCPLRPSTVAFTKRIVWWLGL
jgi:hypothetical protein